MKPGSNICSKTTFGATLSEIKNLQKPIYIVNTPCKSCLQCWGSGTMEGGCITEDRELQNLPVPSPLTHTHLTVLTQHPLNVTPHPKHPPEQCPPPDLLQQGCQREFNTRVPNSSKVIIVVAADRGPSGAR